MQEVLRTTDPKTPRYLIRNDGQRFGLRALPPDFPLSPGDCIERPLRDGDVVVLHRAPAQRRGSMMAHRVRVMPHSTLRLNPAAVRMYDVSCDGGMMTMHVPQSLETKTEVCYYLSLPLLYIIYLFIYLFISFLFSFLFFFNR